MGHTYRASSMQTRGHARARVAVIMTLLAVSVPLAAGQNAGGVTSAPTTSSSAPPPPTADQSKTRNPILNDISPETQDLIVYCIFGGSLFCCTLCMCLMYGVGCNEGKKKRRPKRKPKRKDDDDADVVVMFDGTKTVPPIFSPMNEPERPTRKAKRDRHSKAESNASEATMAAAGHREEPGHLGLYASDDHMYEYDYTAPHQQPPWEQHEVKTFDVYENPMYDDGD
eukprot:m.172047 g.172047  ORF g.172047 m.172047 type:complete len:226 (-) comp13464_c0_seq1:226-903(-)